MRLILVVHEDNNNRRLLVQKFEEANYDVMVASNRDEAFNILTNTLGIEFIIAEHIIPVMDAITMMRIISERFSSLEILALLVINSMTSQRSKELRKIGIRGCVIRPLNYETLVKSVNIILDNKKS